MHTQEHSQDSEALRMEAFNSDIEESRDALPKGNKKDRHGDPAADRTPETFDEILERTRATYESMIRDAYAGAEIESAAALKSMHRTLQDIESEAPGAGVTPYEFKNSAEAETYSVLANRMLASYGKFDASEADLREAYSALTAMRAIHDNAFLSTIEKDIAHRLAA